MDPVLRDPETKSRGAVERRGCPVPVPSAGLARNRDDTSDRVPPSPSRVAVETAVGVKEERAAAPAELNLSEVLPGSSDSANEMFWIPKPGLLRQSEQLILYFFRPRRAAAVAPRGCTKTELVPSVHFKPLSKQSSGNGGICHAIPWSSKWQPSALVAWATPLSPGHVGCRWGHI